MILIPAACTHDQIIIHILEREIPTKIKFNYPVYILEEKIASDPNNLEASYAKVTPFKSLFEET